MPEPTPANVLAALPLIGGRISIAIDEIIRLLTVYLPPAIVAYNAANGTTIQKAAHIRVAPADIDSVDIDEILIEWRKDKVAFGVPYYKDDVTIMIHSIDERIVQGKHTNNVQDRGDILTALLYCALTNWKDPQGRDVWLELAPVSITQLPGEWSKYSGTTATFKMTQVNAANQTN